MVILLKVLKISKEEILNLNTNRIFELCEELTSKKQDVDSRILLTTSCYDNDDRTLPNIPQWCRYMRLVAKDYPALMLFLNNESKELMLTSVTNDLENLTGTDILNLNNKKIEEFINDVEMHLHQLPFINEYIDRIEELNNFMSNFFGKVRK